MLISWSRKKIKKNNAEVSKKEGTILSGDVWVCKKLSSWAWAGGANLSVCGNSLPMFSYRTFAWREPMGQWINNCNLNCNFSHFFGTFSLPHIYIHVFVFHLFGLL